ncbi:MAG: hypothetical protein KDC26_04480 [Armatimonadetes bacterium]|nr:hypothetical protein [Armatimonadota bacterium]
MSEKSKKQSAVIAIQGACIAILSFICIGQYAVSQNLGEVEHTRQICESIIKKGLDPRFAEDVLVGEYEYGGSADGDLYTLGFEKELPRAWGVFRRIAGGSIYYYKDVPIAYRIMKYY